MAFNRRQLLGFGGSLALAVSPVLAGRASGLPAGFHWGVGTAGFQCEGHAPDSNWTRYLAARTPSVRDPYLDATDFLHRYRDDIALAAALGVNTFRFSVEWARVQPAPGVWSQAGLAYYDDLVRTVRAAGMTPMITLLHFTHPGWVVDQGSWANRKTIDDYLAYVRVVVSRYRGLGAFWITVYEPIGYLQLDLLNGAYNPLQFGAASDNIVAAHRRSYELIHQLDPAGRVTGTVSFAPGISPLVDRTFLDQVHDTLDVFGLDYYYGATLSNPSMVGVVANDFADIKPEPRDLYWALKYYHERFADLPIYIVENGMPTADGAPRPDGYTPPNYLRDHIYWMQRVMREGIPVIGYNYWSLTDSYEWGTYSERFGLYAVDVRTDPTLTRRQTSTAAAYRQIIRDGGVPMAYRPVMPGGFCSLSDLPASCLDDSAPLIPPP